MTRDRWTFLVVSDDSGPVRQFSVRKGILRASAAAGGFLGLGLVALVAFAFLGGRAGVESLVLERKNQVLEAELEEVRERLGQLEGDLGELAGRDAQLRVLAGLDTIDPEVAQVGVGGPGMPVPEDHPLWTLDPSLGEEAFAVRYDLGALERRARLLAESLDQASDSLEAHRDLLESTPSILPTPGFLSSGFSQARRHPIHHRELPHEGVDLAAPRGTPILAAARGQVVFSGRRSGYGLVVELDHGYGYSTLYGHAAEILVRDRQRVDRGEIIARVGNTGLATSPHLHYEVRVGGRAVDPMNYIITDAVP